MCFRRLPTRAAAASTLRWSITRCSLLIPLADSRIITTCEIVCFLCEPAFGSLLCGLLGAAAGLIIAFIVWLLSKLFNDPDDGEAGEISVDVPEGAEVDARAKDEVGDVVLALGDWIMDV